MKSNLFWQFVVAALTLTLWHLVAKPHNEIQIIIGIQYWAGARVQSGSAAIGHLISIMGTWLGDLTTNNVTNTSIKTTNISLNTAQGVRCVTFQQHHHGYFTRTMNQDKLLIVCSRNFPSQNWAFIFWFMDLTLGWKLRARQDLLFVACSSQSWLSCFKNIYWFDFCTYLRLPHFRGGGH